jgi:hypothetical protein
MSLPGSCPVVVPSRRPGGGGPLPTGHPAREHESDALRAEVLP